MKDHGLDEMQLAKRNQIGHQTLMLLFYLLLLDIGLYGLGVKWLDYPMNVFVLMMACMSLYLLRVAKAGAYGGAKKKAGNTGKTAAVLVIAITASLFTSAYIGKWRQEDTYDGGALLLFILSAAVLLAGFILMKWNERKNNQGDD